jgi:hypothetical protein
MLSLVGGPRRAGEPRVGFPLLAPRLLFQDAAPDLGESETRDEEIGVILFAELWAWSTPA